MQGQPKVTQPHHGHPVSRLPTEHPQPVQTSGRIIPDGDVTELYAKHREHTEQRQYGKTHIWGSTMKPEPRREEQNDEPAFDINTHHLKYQAPSVPLMSYPDVGLVGFAPDQQSVIDAIADREGPYHTRKLSLDQTFLDLREEHATGRSLLPGILIVHGRHESEITRLHYAKRSRVVVYQPDKAPVTDRHRIQRLGCTLARNEQDLTYLLAEERRRVDELNGLMR